MKIAIPVGEDKKTVFKRTGQAPYFLVFENDILIDTVANMHTNNDSGEHDHKKDLEPLSDCDIMIVQAIGGKSKEALDYYKIDIKKVKKEDGENAYKVVKNYLSTNLKVLK